jgi:hypothetical protein
MNLCKIANPFSIAILGSKRIFNPTPKPFQPDPSMGRSGCTSSHPMHEISVDVSFPTTISFASCNPSPQHYFFFSFFFSFFHPCRFVQEFMLENEGHLKISYHQNWPYQSKNDLII